MSVQFVEYQDLLTSFYCHVTRNHSDKQKLLQRFQTIIDKASQKTISENNLSQSSKKTLYQNIKKNNQNRENGQQQSKVSISQNKTESETEIFETNSFAKIFLFAYMHHLIKNEQSSMFKLFEVKVNLVLKKNQGKLVNKPTIQKIMIEWKKINQLIQYKFKINWEQVLKKSFRVFEEWFLMILLESTLMFSSKLEQSSFQPTKINLMRASKELKLQIVFSQMVQKGSPPLQQINTGSYLSKISIEHYLTSNRYVLIGAMLDKQNNISNKEFDLEEFQNLHKIKSQKSLVLIDHSKRIMEAKSEKLFSKDKQTRSISKILFRRKALRTIGMLIKQYKSDTERFKDLNCLKNNRKSTSNDINLRTLGKLNKS